jgi:hypothetical protein
MTLLAEVITIALCIIGALTMLRGLFSGGKRGEE